MKNIAVSFVVGFIFSLGLGLSGMTQPVKVVGFLDVFGDWDPALIFVMGGAIAVHFITYRLITKRSTPLFSTQWHLPTSRELTPSLIIGAFLFGIGWGISGYCPGPAVTSLASFEPAPVIFVIFMLVGMLLFKQVDKILNLKK